VYWAAWHSSVNDEVSAAHDRCVEHVRKLAGDLRAVAVCCDSPRSVRREKHVEYKAQRPAKDHASIEELKRTKETLRRDGFLIWECDGYEADDVIASAVAAAPDDCSILVASADKDLLQLVCDLDPSKDGAGRHVRVVSTKTGAFLDEAAVREKTGVHPSKVRDWLALVGDKSDNVKGVPGIGPVKAAALLNEFGNIEATLVALQNNDTHKLFTPALANELRTTENLKNLATAQYLVKLVDTLPVAFGEIFEERQAEPLVTPSGDFDDEDPSANPKHPQIEAEAPPPSERRQAEPQQAPSAPEPRTELVVAPRNQLATEPAQPSTIAVSAYEMQLQPQTLKAASVLAETLFNSRLYTKLGNKEAIFAVILRGREMGLTALLSLDMFDVVEGRPTMKAHTLISRAKAHPDCVYFRWIEGDDTYAIYETKNKQYPDSPTRLKYTIEQAKRAGMLKPNSNWEKRPAEMLRKTCGVQLARIEYPDALHGLYATEELAA